MSTASLDAQRVRGFHHASLYYDSHQYRTLGSDDRVLVVEPCGSAVEPGDGSQFSGSVDLKYLPERIVPSVREAQEKKSSS